MALAPLSNQGLNHILQSTAGYVTAQSATTGLTASPTMPGVSMGKSPLSRTEVEENRLNILDTKLNFSMALKAEFGLSEKVIKYIENKIDIQNDTPLKLADAKVLVEELATLKQVMNKTLPKEAMEGLKNFKLAPKSNSDTEEATSYTSQMFAHFQSGTTNQPPQTSGQSTGDSSTDVDSGTSTRSRSDQLDIDVIDDDAPKSGTLPSELTGSPPMPTTQSTGNGTSVSGQIPDDLELDIDLLDDGAPDQPDVGVKKSEDTGGSTTTDIVIDDQPWVNAPLEPPKPLMSHVSPEDLEKFVPSLTKSKDQEPEIRPSDLPVKSNAKTEGPEKERDRFELTGKETSEDLHKIARDLRTELADMDDFDDGDPN